MPTFLQRKENHFDQSRFGGVVPSETRKVGFWSYKVDKADHNYADRTDKVDDWMDFDSDQNFQIEMHYKACCDGITNKFGDKYIIVGD